MFFPFPSSFTSVFDSPIQSCVLTSLCGNAAGKCLNNNEKTWTHTDSMSIFLLLLLIRLFEHQGWREWNSGDFQDLWGNQLKVLCVVTPADQLYFLGLLWCHQCEAEQAVFFCAFEELPFILIFFFFFTFVGENKSNLEYLLQVQYFFRILDGWRKGGNTLHSPHTTRTSLLSQFSVYCFSLMQIK